MRGKAHWIIRVHRVVSALQMIYLEVKTDYFVLTARVGRDSGTIKYNVQVGTE